MSFGIFKNTKYRDAKGRFSDGYNAWDYRKSLDLEERFWAKVNKTDSCWIWTGAKDSKGYGLFWNKKHFKAHRFSYELLMGKIPEGLIIDHRCRVRECVNPAHLEPVLNRENILRGIGIAAINSKKIYCIHGHKLNENRKCVECHRIRSREYRRRLKCRSML